MKWHRQQVLKSATPWPSHRDERKGAVLSLQRSRTVQSPAWKSHVELTPPQAQGAAGGSALCWQQLPAHTQSTEAVRIPGAPPLPGTLTPTLLAHCFVCVFISSYVYINKKRTKGTYEAIKDFLAYSVQASLLRLLPGIWLGFCASEHQHQLLSLGCCISITNSDESQPSQSRLVMSK